MKLPVWPKDKCNYTDNPVIEIIDEDGKFVAKIRNVETRAYIIKTINSHEKLVEALDEIEAVSCGEKQIEADGDYDDSDGLLWIYKRIQALKEKPK